MTAMTVEPGTLLAAKYRVLRTIGRGGMGVVVEALHEELDQKVAIKLMAREAAQNAEWATRFQREARAAARIKSEHVVRVMDVGKLENGQPYMVMELLEGEDLAAMLSHKQRLSISQAIDFILQTSEALAEAHANGIVHRDLKPANLFVTERADEPWIKVLDFGISKVANDPTQVTVTNTSAIVGSPLYMSPEQMRASKSVDARTDIWALGVILHEMVTGRPPFDGSTAPELCALVLTAPPSRVTETLPNAPPALEAIVMKCLEKDASKRYANVAELAHALAELTPTARPAADRIVRLLTGKTKQPSLVGLPAPETARVAVTPDPGEQVSDVGDTIASDKKPPPRIVEGPTMVSAGSEPKKKPSAATIAQGPLPEAPVIQEAPPPQVGASTAAAWGNTGASDGPKPTRFVPYVIVGVVATAITFVAIYLAMNKSDPATTTTASSAPQKPSVATPTTTTAQPIATTTVDAGAPSIDINALPTVTTSKPTTTTVRPTNTTKPTTQPKPPDTSEFGGRK